MPIPKPCSVTLDSCDRNTVEEDEGGDPSCSIRGKSGRLLNDAFSALRHCYRPNACGTLKFLCGNPSCPVSVIIFGDGIQGRGLGHEMQQSVPLQKRSPRAPCSFLHRRTEQKDRWLSMNQELGSHLTPNLPEP